MLEIAPLSAVNFKDFVQLMGEKGGCGQCWCMNNRRTKADFECGKVDGSNKKMLERMAVAGDNLGFLFYLEDEPVGWISVGPWQQFVRLEKSKTLRPFDALPTWLITCFFVRKSERQQGYSKKMLAILLAFVADKFPEVPALDAFPFNPQSKLPDPFVWGGVLSTFLDLGFQRQRGTSKSRIGVRFSLKR